MAVVTHLIDILDLELLEEDLAPPCAACSNLATWIMRHKCCDFFQFICTEHHQKYVAFFQSLAVRTLSMECLECGAFHTSPTFCVDWEKL